MLKTSCYLQCHLTDLAHRNKFKGSTTKPSLPCWTATRTITLHPWRLLVPPTRCSCPSLLAQATQPSGRTPGTVRVTLGWPQGEDAFREAWVGQVIHHGAVGQILTQGDGEGHFLGRGQGHGVALVPWHCGCCGVVEGAERPLRSATAGDLRGHSGVVRCANHTLAALCASFDSVRFMRHLPAHRFPCARLHWQWQRLAQVRAAILLLVGTGLLGNLPQLPLALLQILEVPGTHSNPQISITWACSPHYSPRPNQWELSFTAFFFFFQMILIHLKSLFAAIWQLSFVQSVCLCVQATECVCMHACMCVCLCEYLEVSMDKILWFIKYMDYSNCILTSCQPHRVTHLRTNQTPS